MLFFLHAYHLRWVFYIYHVFKFCFYLNWKFIGIFSSLYIRLKFLKFLMLNRLETWVIIHLDFLEYIYIFRLYFWTLHWFWKLIVLWWWWRETYSETFLLHDIFCNARGDIDIVLVWWCVILWSDYPVT